jgi:hypothetical protein
MHSLLLPGVPCLYTAVLQNVCATHLHQLDVAFLQQQVHCLALPAC